MSNENEIVEVNNILPVDNIIQQVNAVNNILSKVMVDGVHFGKIPGCGDKPTLLKPGAEILSMAFGLDLQTETEIVELHGGHREYRSVTTAYSKANGSRFGNGEGCATTMESKWRYRAENTGALVPVDYWKSRDSELIGGSQFSTRKIDKTWYIFHKVEHDNPADYYNTCLKMAEKRSRVACTLNVTSASNLFTQDIEDMPQAGTGTTAKDKPEIKKTQSKSAKKQTNAGKEGKADQDEVITKIADVTEYNGTAKSTGKPFTQYTIHSVGGTEYKTFDKKEKEKAEKIVNTDEECLILFTVDKFGNTIDSLELQ